MKLRNDTHSRALLMNIILSVILLYLAYADLITVFEKHEVAKGIVLAIFAIIALYSIYCLVTYAAAFLAITVFIAACLFIFFKMDFSAIGNIKMKPNSEIAWRR